MSGSETRHEHGYVTLLYTVHLPRCGTWLPLTPEPVGTLSSHLYMHTPKARQCSSLLGRCCQVKPLEDECRALQRDLSQELRAHQSTREDLFELKSTYHRELDSWKEQLDIERKARDGMLLRHNAEIKDLGERRARSEELLADQDRTLRFREGVMKDMQGKLTAAEIRTDQLEHDVDALERRLRDAKDELQNEKEQAAIQLASMKQTMEQAHQMELRALEQIREREKARLNAQIDQIKADMATQAAEVRAI